MTNFSITVEATPNPQTLKFKFSHALLESPIDCPNAQEAEKSPLASKIFGFPWTNSVFLGQDFISVTKQDWVDWDILAEPLVELIQSHIENEEPLHLELPNEDIHEDDSDFIRAVKKTLNKEIRPMLAYDGGDVTFTKFEEGKLFLQFQGACSGCPSKSVTLKQGIEVRLKELFPEITEVVGA